MTQSQRDELLVRLDVGLNGNGGKGLNGRMDDMEDWKETRPQECPAKKPDRLVIIKQRALEVTILGLVLAGANFVAKAMGLW